MNLTNSMIILFHNFFFEILYAALACCENWDKIMLFGCVIKNKPICLHIVLLAFYNTTCPCALVIPFSIISFRICPTAYIIYIKKVNISHLQCIEVGGNISLMTNNQQQLGFVCIFSFFWYIKIPLEDGSSNLSADSVLVFKVIWRDSHFLFSVILFIKS